ncbi:MAG TPA: hypothetical protein VII95_07850 [Terriglobales bacterium]|jgi:hypothetical protein
MFELRCSEFELGCSESAGTPAQQRSWAVLSSAGAAATATVAGSTYSIAPSAALGTGLSNYTISYVNGQLTVNSHRFTSSGNRWH